MNRIEKAIDIFLDALNKGTLAKGSCAHCAVGNILSDAQKEECTDWGHIFCTVEGRQIFKPWNFSALPNVQVAISNSGFTLFELMEIENTFETNTEIHQLSYPNYTKEQIRADQIKGLSAVIAVMQTFEETEENYVEEFQQKAELIFV